MKGVGMLVVSLRGVNFGFYSHHREPAQSVCVADCYFIVNAVF